jgi:2-oxoglutarate dehydrogenase complex dehydrogenase (E1) component-like enzyme
LSPFPAPEEIIGKIGDIEKYVSIIWCQEEPKNMGAYTFIQSKFVEMFGKSIQYVGREASAAPATAISKQHKQQTQDIFNKLKSL